jgi:catechol 2,3-dioxygenase-like lactoylglutathione lyase family enzyme
MIPTGASVSMLASKPAPEALMALTQLNHVTVRTGDLEATRTFYESVLGLTAGPRPPFRFPGYWLYCGENPVVHLVLHTDAIGGGAATDTGSFDHVAFTADDFPRTRERLISLGVAFREQQVPGASNRQLFVEDPNRVTIELNFPSAE